MFVYPVIVLFDFLKNMLKPLGDPEYQQRVWIEQRGPEVDDYDDATMYFMDKCEEIFGKPNGFEGVDIAIKNYLKILYDRVCKFDKEIANNIPEGREEEIINHPEWRKIQKIANETYEIIMKNLKERNYECN